MKSNRPLHFRRPAFYVGVVLCCLFTLNACTSRHFIRGVRAYDQERYADAAYAMEKSMQKWPNDTMAMRMLGESQLILNRHDAAERTYLELETRATLTNFDRLQLGAALMQQGKYTESTLVLEHLMISNYPNPYAQVLWDKCMDELYVDEDDRDWNVERLDIPGVNAASAPYFHDGRLYFCQGVVEDVSTTDPARLELSNMHVINGWGSDRNSLRASTVSNWDVPAHDGIAVLSPDGKSVAFSRKGKAGIGWFGDPIQGGYQLLIAQRNAIGDWAESRPFPFVEKGYIFAHPTWSPDGSKLYFATDIPSPQSQGGLDLWYSERNGTFWEEPVNLGPTINTAGDEGFPSFSHEDTLYFASNGHPTRGGFDLFCSTYDRNATEKTNWWDGEPWKIPERLAFPINTATDDYSIAFEPGNKTGYICSNRSGNDAIYAIAIENDPVHLECQTVSSKSGKPLPRTPVTFIDTEDGAALQITSDLDGHIALNVPHGRSYRVAANLAGHLVERTTIHPQNAETHVLALSDIGRLRDFQFMNSYLGGTPFEIHDLHPTPDHKIADQKSRKDLYELADFMKLNPQILLEIRTHDNAIGLKAYAELTTRPSKLAAIDVESFLLKQGVSSKQMVALGAGVRELKNKCVPGAPCSTISHRENDRVEFRIYGLLQASPGQKKNAASSQNWDQFRSERSGE